MEIDPNLTLGQAVKNFVAAKRRTVMAKKAVSDKPNFLDDDSIDLSDESKTERLLGKPAQIVEIDPNLTLGQAVKNFVAAKQASAQANAVAEELKKDLAYAQQALYLTMNNQDPPMPSVTIAGGTTLTAYELTVGNLIGGQEACIDRIKADGLDDRLIKEVVIKAEVDKLTKELIEEGAPFPDWLKPVGVPKISMTTTKNKGA